MKLSSNWKTILFGSWSVWCISAGLISLMGFFFALVSPGLLGWNSLYFAITSAVFQALAIPARLILQRRLSGRLARRSQFRSDLSGMVKTRRVGAIAGSGVALAAAITFIGGWEGLRTEAYRDVVGVWTVCYGETSGVRAQDRYSEVECDEKLALQITRYEAALDKCLRVQVPLGMKIALVSWTYNVGAGAACSSTLVRKANAGDLAGACDELKRWNKAGGRVWRGLTRRRFSEMEMCHAALRDAALREPALREPA